MLRLRHGHPMFPDEQGDHIRRFPIIVKIDRVLKRVLTSAAAKNPAEILKEDCRIRL